MTPDFLSIIQSYEARIIQLELAVALLTPALAGPSIEMPARPAPQKPANDDFFVTTKSRILQVISERSGPLRSDRMFLSGRKGIFESRDPRLRGIARSKILAVALAAIESGEIVSDPSTGLTVNASATPGVTPRRASDLSATVQH